MAFKQAEGFSRKNFVFARTFYHTWYTPLMALEQRVAESLLQKQEMRVR